MSASIYPDAATAAALGKPAHRPVRLAVNEAMSVFVPLFGHVGADPSQQNLPTMFVRIALSGPPVVAHPKVELIAHDPARPGGGAPSSLDPGTATSLTSAVHLSDGNPLRPFAARAYFAGPPRDNVYALRVVIDIAGTAIRIRITNTTGVERDLVWVEADSDADSQRPWLHVVPAAIRFDAVAGEDEVQQLEITNRGTGAVTVTGVAPPIGSRYTLSGLPVTIGPNPATPAAVRVGFQHAQAIQEVAATQHSVVMSGTPDPGPFGIGHNNTFSVSARTRPPEEELRCRGRLPGGFPCQCTGYVGPTPPAGNCRRPGCGHPFRRHLAE